MLIPLRMVARDPSFAPAWGLLAQTYIQVPPYSPILRNGSVEEIGRLQQTAWGKAEMAAREAIRLDPKHASGYAALASVMTTQKNWAVGEDLYAKALGLDPDDPDVQHSYGLFLQVSGQFKKALEVREKLRMQEPFVPVFNLVLADTLRLAGQTERAIQLAEDVPQIGGTNYFRNLLLGVAYATSKRYGEAADTLLAITNNQMTTRKTIEDAARLLRQAPTKLNPRTLPRLDGELDFVYAHVGAPERVLEFPERLPGLGDTPSSMDIVLWLPEAAPVRKTQRFKALMRRIGLVNYWRERGWPDLCRPQGTDDFVCD